MLREHPISFTGEMVNAILVGRKTQTRRIVKPNRRKDGVQLVPELLRDIGVGHACPYGVVGDRLWVRERAYVAPLHFSGWDLCNATDEEGNRRMVGYKVPNEAAEDYGLKPRPAFLMPQWASRLTLEIESVRVERLQEITEEDARAEGVVKGQFRDDEASPRLATGYCVHGQDIDDDFAPTPQEAYRRLWESINGPGSWDANPFVWVVAFRRVEP